MAETRTDDEGYFKLDGSADRLITEIDAELKIYHNCNARTNICERRWVYKLPDRYINGPELDIGVWNLELHPEEEDTDCFGKK